MCARSGGRDASSRQRAMPRRRRRDADGARSRLGEVDVREQVDEPVKLAEPRREPRVSESLEQRRGRLRVGHPVSVVDALRPPSSLRRGPVAAKMVGRHPGNARFRFASTRGHLWRRPRPLGNGDGRAHGPRQRWCALALLPLIAWTRTRKLGGPSSRSPSSPRRRRYGFSRSPWAAYARGSRLVAEPLGAPTMGRFERSRAPAASALAAFLVVVLTASSPARLARAPCRCDGRRTRHADRLVPRLPWRPLSKRRGRGRRLGTLVGAAAGGLHLLRERERVTVR